MNKKLLGIILMIGLLSGCNMTPQQWQEVSKGLSGAGKALSEAGRSPRQSTHTTCNTQGNRTNCSTW